MKKVYMLVLLVLAIVLAVGLLAANRVALSPALLPETTEVFSYADYPILAALPEHEISIHADPSDDSGAAWLRMNEQWISIHCPFKKNNMPPELYYADFDGDGVSELIIIQQITSTPGIHSQRMILVRSGTDGLSVHEPDCDAWIAYDVHQYNNSDIVLDLHLGGQRRYVLFLRPLSADDEAEYKLITLITDENIHFSVTDTDIMAEINLAAVINTEPMPVDFGMLTADVRIDGSEFVLGAATLTLTRAEDREWQNWFTALDNTYRLSILKYGHYPYHLTEMAAAYREGAGVERNMDTAIRWYKKAVEYNWALAAVRLAEAYESGEAGQIDFGGALSYYRQAYALGYELALADIARFHAGGLGIPKDRATAFRLLIDSLFTIDDGARYLDELYAELVFAVLLDMAEETTEDMGGLTYEAVLLAAAKSGVDRANTKLMTTHRHLLLSSLKPWGLPAAENLVEPIQEMLASYSGFWETARDEITVEPNMTQREVMDMPGYKDGYLAPFADPDHLSLYKVDFDGDGLLELIEFQMGGTMGNESALVHHLDENGAITHWNRGEFMRTLTLVEEDGQYAILERLFDYYDKETTGTCLITMDAHGIMYTTRIERSILSARTIYSEQAETAPIGLLARLEAEWMQHINFYKSYMYFDCEVPIESDVEPLIWEGEVIKKEYLGALDVNNDGTDEFVAEYLFYPASAHLEYHQELTAYYLGESGSAERLHITNLLTGADCLTGGRIVPIEHEGKLYFLVIGRIAPALYTFRLCEIVGLDAVEHARFLVSADETITIQSALYKEYAD